MAEANQHGEDFQSQKPVKPARLFGRELEELQLLSGISIPHLVVRLMRIEGGLKQWRNKWYSKKLPGWRWLKV